MKVFLVEDSPLVLARLTAMVGGYSHELQLTFEAMVALDALNARAT